MSLFQSITDKAKEATQSRTFLTWAFFIVLVYLIRRELRKQVQNKEYDSLGTNEQAQLAYRIRQACNPWGTFGGFSSIDFDGTEEQDLYIIATEIRNWQAVQDSYYNLYGERLVSRLENELGDDFVQFLNLIPKTGSTTPAGQTTNYYGYKVYGKVQIELLDIATLNPSAGGRYPANTYIGTHGGEVLINNTLYVIVVRKGALITLKNLAVKSQLYFQK